jgi:hypothetical protein
MAHRAYSLALVREDQRALCDDFGCPRLFRLDDCSTGACPKVAGIQIAYLAPDGEAHIVAEIDQRRLK